MRFIKAFSETQKDSRINAKNISEIIFNNKEDDCFDVIMTNGNRYYIEKSDYWTESGTDAYSEQDMQEYDKNFLKKIESC